MDDLEQRIESVLNDPEQMAKIMEMAQSLGIKPDAAPGTEPKPSRTANEKEMDLLRALKPFLKPNHRNRIEKVMQVARFTNIAKMALSQAEDDAE